MTTTTLGHFISVPDTIPFAVISATYTHYCWFPGSIPLEITCDLFFLVVTVVSIIMITELAIALNKRGVSVPQTLLVMLCSVGLSYSWSHG